MNENEIMSLRTENENPTEWRLRKIFLEAHYEKLPLDRLICMSCCFINVEVNGCRYPDPVMSLLRDLMEEIKDGVDAHRDRVKSRTEVKFVKASTSDKESSKQSSSKKTPYGMRFVKSSSDLGSDSSPSISSSSTGSNTIIKPTRSTNVSFVKSKQDYHSTDISVTASSSKSNAPTIQNVDPIFIKFAGVLKDLLCTDGGKNATELFYMAASKVKLPWDISVNFALSNQCQVAKVYVNFVQVGMAEAQNRKKAKQAAFEDALTKVCKPHLRVVIDNQEKILECSDEPFSDVDVKVEEQFSNNQEKILECSDEPFLDVDANVVKQFSNNREKILECSNEPFSDVDANVAKQLSMFKKQAFINGPSTSQNSSSSKMYSDNFITEPHVNTSIESNLKSRLGKQSSPHTPIKSDVKSRLGKQLSIKSRLGKRSARQAFQISNFVLYEPQIKHNGCNAASILRMSADFSKCNLEMNYLPNGFSMKCSVYLDGQLISEAVGGDKKAIKDEACISALNILRQSYYTIQIKPKNHEDADRVTKEELTEDKTDEAIPDSNIGNKLLKMMGWSGGGVGKSGQGIAEPVNVDSVINREGLGLRESQGITKEFNEKIKTMLHEYAVSYDEKELVFSPYFAKEERAIIHNEAKKLKLKSKSYNQKSANGIERYLVISRKKGPDQLFQQLLREGETATHGLIPPGEHNEILNE